MELSNSISELFQLDEDKCKQILAKVKWNGTPTCPRCECQKVYFLKTRAIYKCSSCNKQFSLTQNTIFERTKLPLSKWFSAIRLFLHKNSINSCELARQLKIEQHSAWYMLMKLRHALSEENEPSEMLRGIVEVDETFFSFNKGQDLARNYSLREKNKERKKNGLPKLEHQTITLGMIERSEYNNGRLILKKIGRSRNAINQKNIIPILKKYISQDTFLITDNAPVYKRTCDYFELYRWIVHTERIPVTKNDGTKSFKVVKNFVDSEFPEVHTNSIENVWKQLKRVRETYFHYSYKHAQKYFDEFSFKWNNTDDADRLMGLFLKRSIRNPQTKKQLAT